jgi:hypothetical protein
MWHPQTVNRFQAEYMALQTMRAGSALACAYSSSDEFEAAVIRSKVDAGIYGPKRRRRHVLYGAAAVGALVIAFLLML